MAESLGPPPRPESDVSFEGVTIPFIEMPDSSLPTCPEELGVNMECKEQENKVCVWYMFNNHASITYVYLQTFWSQKNHFF